MQIHAINNPTAAAAGDSLAEQDVLAEQISAWMDGALSEAESARLIDRLLADPAAQALWLTYQRASEWCVQADKPTSTQPHSVASEQALSARILAALATEPLHMMPNKPTPRGLNTKRWSAWGAMAAGVIFVLWAGLPLIQQNPAAVNAVGLAQLGAQNGAASTAPHAARNSSESAFDPYLRVHQQSVGWSRVQAAPAYVRTAEDRALPGQPAPLTQAVH
jgi:negative regulator of sigma E activity